MASLVKDKFVQIRASEDERNMLKGLAAENNMTVAELIMHMARYFESEGLSVTFVPKMQAPVAELRIGQDEAGGGSKEKAPHVSARRLYKSI